MRTVIYLDVLLLVNFVVGAAFLLAAGLLCGACCSPLRLVGGAGAAAVSSLALLAPTAPWPLALTYKGTSAVLCVAAAYGWQGARNTARLTAWFVLLNLTLTGGAFPARRGLQQPQLSICRCRRGCCWRPRRGSAAWWRGCCTFWAAAARPAFGAELSVAGRVRPAERLPRQPGFHVQEPLSGRAVVLVRLDAVSLPPGVRAYLDALPRGRRRRAPPGVGRAVRTLSDRRGTLVCCPPCLPHLRQTVENRTEYTQRFAICRLRRGDGRLSSAQETAALLGK